MKKLYLGAVLGVLLAPGIASAQQCGSFEPEAVDATETGGNIILVGRYRRAVWVPANSGMPGFWFWYPYQVGVVWQAADGGWGYGGVAGCPLTTAATNPAVISGGAGNDTIIVYPAGEPKIGGTIGSGKFEFDPLPYGDPMLTVTLDLRGGTGSDTVYGGPGNDDLYSNNPALTEDNQTDYLCGMAGSDDLVGDRDGDNDADDRYDCLMAGVGPDTNDTCDSSDAYTPDYDGHDSYCDVVAPGSTHAFRFYSCSVIPCRWITTHACYGSCSGPPHVVTTWPTIP